MELCLSGCGSACSPPAAARTSAPSSRPPRAGRIPAAVVGADRRPGGRAGARHRARAPASRRSCVDPRQHPSREAHEKAVIGGARGAPGRARVPGRLHAAPDRRASSRTSRGRLLNIHPSLLPCVPGPSRRSGRPSSPRGAGVGRHRALRGRGRRHGPDRAAGRGAGASRTTPRRRLAARILVEEHRIYPEAVRLFAEGRLEIHGRRVSHQGDAMTQGSDALSSACTTRPGWWTSRGAWPRSASRSSPPAAPPSCCATPGSRWWTWPRSPAFPRCSTVASRRSTPRSTAASWPGATLPEHLAALERHGIRPIDLVAVTLYPFEQTVAQAGRDARGGDREHRHRRPEHDPGRGQEPRPRRRCVTDPGQYAPVLDELRQAGGDALGRDALPAGRARPSGAPHSTTRRSRPTSAIRPRPDRPAAAGFPGAAARSTACACSRSATARTRTRRPRSTVRPRAALGLSAAAQLHGPELSLQQPARLVGRARPAARVRRSGRGGDQAHQSRAASPSARSAGEAVRRAKACDPVSIYGGIVGVNRTGRPGGRQGAVRHPARDPLRARLRAGRARGDPPDQEEVPRLPAPVRAPRLPGARCRRSGACWGGLLLQEADLVDLDPARAQGGLATRAHRGRDAGAALRVARGASTPSPTRSCSPPPTRWWAWAPVR